MKKIFTKKLFWLGLSTVSIAPIIAVVSCGPSGENSSKITLKNAEVNEQLTRDDIQKIMDGITNGVYTSYSLEGKKYDIISTEDYENNTKPLVEYISKYFPTLIYKNDSTIKDTGKIRLVNFPDFNNVEQSLKINEHFTNIEPPKLPDGYFWEFSNDDLYQRTSPDGTKVSYWTNSIKNFIVPGDLASDKVFTFKARINFEYGLRIFDNQEQTFTINVKLIN